jgi:hypothetical protein
MAENDKRTLMPVKELRMLAAQVASNLLVDWVGEERAKEAAGRISSALAACCSSARDPSDFLACTKESVGACVALAALSGIMPGTGPTALAYVIPRRARRGEQPQLKYEFSHRGIAALAKRCGTLLYACPVSQKDELQIHNGEVVRHVQSPDDPPMTWDDLRGVIVTVKNINTAATLFRGWVPKVEIAKRRDMSDAYRFAEAGGEAAKRTSPWHQWPIEMSMKTAMHYAGARGWVVIDDSVIARCLSMDAQASELPQIQPVEVSARRSHVEVLAERLGIGIKDAGQQEDSSGEVRREGEHDLPENGGGADKDATLYDEQ